MLGRRKALKEKILILLDIDTGSGFGLSTREIEDYILSLDILDSLKCKSKAISYTLHELADAGKITRIKRGRHYWWLPARAGSNALVVPSSLNAPH